MRVFLLVVVATITPLVATDYLSFEEAMAMAFPRAATVERLHPEIPAAKKQAVVDAAQLHDGLRARLGGIYVGANGGELTGVAFVDHVVGRTEYISYLCVLDPDGAIRQVAVMSYREPIGGEVRHERFTNQFIGKDAEDRIKLRRDIANIAGATLSCWGMTARIRFLVHLYDLALREQAGIWAEQQDEVLPDDSTSASEPTSRSLPLGNSIFRAQAWVDDDQLHRESIALAQECDAAVNEWREDGPLQNLVSGEPVPVPPSAASLLRTVQRCHRISEGWFDPTIGPLLRLWWQASEAGAIPSSKEQARARALVGFEKVAFLSDGRLQAPVGTHLDFGGIRKGAAVAAARNYFDQAGVACLIDHGQSVWSAGIHSPPQPWMIRLSTFFAMEAVMLEPGQSLAVSDSGGRTFGIDGRVFSHLIDPHGGHPVAPGRRAAVLADDPAMADALATVLCMAPIEQCRDILARVPGAAALLVIGGEVVALGEGSFRVSQ